MSVILQINLYRPNHLETQELWDIWYIDKINKTNVSECTHCVGCYWHVHTMADGYKLIKCYNISIKENKNILNGHVLKSRSREGVTARGLLWEPVPSDGIDMSYQLGWLYDYGKLEHCWMTVLTRLVDWLIYVMKVMFSFMRVKLMNLVETRMWLAQLLVEFLHDVHSYIITKQTKTRLNSKM